MIYLDHQASAPMAEGVLDAMLPFLEGRYGNPHSDDHAAGWEASEAVERARGQVAAAIGCEPDEIVFTSGATEANNIALLGAASVLEDGPRRILVSAIEHKAVLAPARALAAHGHELVVVPVGPDGRIDMDMLDAEIARGADLVSVGAVNNEIGTVQDLAAVAELAAGAGALFHSDATQALAWRGFDALSAGVDLASFSAHKMGGPKGIGALYVARDARGRIAPIAHGGEQEDGLRPGTLPTPSCVGFGEACSRLPDPLGVAAWQAVTDRLEASLLGAFPALRRNGSRGDRHPGNLSLTLPGLYAGVLVARLQPDVAVARGSACTSGMPEPSHVLRAIGLGAEEAEATLRLSTGPGTTADEVDEAVALIVAAVRDQGE